MALKDSWEQQKQQRQQAAIERRQKVHEALTVTQQERQEKASQLRSDLSLFRETLASDDRSRNLEFQHFYAELKTETQAFLLNIRNQRQAQAQKTAQQLNEFVQNLQQQTASFLAMTEAERLLMARQLADDLQSFQSTLEANVSSLRQDIQLELQDLQIETQLLLDQYRQQHIKTQIRSARNLIAFTANLRSSIQEYLLEVSETRQKETELLAQRLQKSRRDRSAKVQALFGQLAEFRLQIQQYHANLKTIVWGEEMALCPVISETQKSATIAPQSTPHLLLQKPIFSEASAQKIAPSQPSRAVDPQPKPAAPSKSAEDNYEEKVYQYIASMQGARLTEIESSLGISRFLAVDALRSLIQKGLVTQRDRVYRIQEDFTV